MAFGNRGKYAEDKVTNFLKEWAHADTHREASRLVDTKAAGRTIKAAKADFEYFCPDWHGLIEVKQTEHQYRLERSKVTQLPSLRKRDKVGGACVVVVYHSTLQVWRAVTVAWLAVNGDKGSWSLQAIPTFQYCGLALGNVLPEVFGSNPT